MKLIAILAAGLGALAFWRREQVKSTARRVSSSAGEAASSMRNKLVRAPDDEPAVESGQVDGEVAGEHGEEEVATSSAATGPASPPEESATAGQPSPPASG